MSAYAGSALPIARIACRYFLEYVEPVHIKTNVELIAKMGDLRRGDQLAVKFKVGGKEFFHHGIYLGTDENCKVIEFGDYGIRETDLMVFRPQGQSLFRITYPDGPAHDPADVVLEALAFFYREFNWGKYHVLRNNCEHFATWCKTKMKISPQASKELQQNLLVKMFEVGMMVLDASSGSSRSMVPIARLTRRYFLEGVEPVHIKTNVELITKTGDLQRGDQLAAKFNVGHKEFLHHGIYLGTDENCKVIEFGDYGIRERDIMEFHPQGQSLFRITYPDGPELDPADVVLEALAFLFEFNWGKYDVLKNNCEHFATWCKTKTKISPQAFKELQQNLLVKMFEVGKMVFAASSRSLTYSSK